MIVSFKTGNKWQGKTKVIVSFFTQHAVLSILVMLVVIFTDILPIFHIFARTPFTGIWKDKFHLFYMTFETNTSLMLLFSIMIYMQLFTVSITKEIIISFSLSTLLSCLLFKFIMTGCLLLITYWHLDMQSNYTGWVSENYGY